MNAGPQDSRKLERRSLVVGVIGAGTMGKGIARLLADSGHSLRVYDQESGLVAGWLSELDGGASSGNIFEADSLAAAVKDADLVVEAVAEDRAVKSSVLKEICAHAPETCVIASNTSSFPIDVMAADCTNPSRFLGVHFFNPADIIPGVEVIAGEATSPDVIAFALDLLTDAGKRPAVVKSSPAFIANRLQMALFLECLRCVDEGLVTPEDLDTVVSTTFGFRLPLFGQFAIADMAGLDVYQSILATLEESYGQRFAAPEALLARTSRGEVGVKVGKGFGTYDAQARADLIASRDDNYQRLRAILAGDGDQQTA